MMNSGTRRLVFFLVMLMLAVSAVARADGALRIPVRGAFHGGGEFEGTITVNRFAARGNAVVAIGFVSGVLTRGNKNLGSALVGEVVWPVTVSSGAASVSARSAVAPQQSCPVIQIALGPHDVNILGFDVALGAVSFDIVGEQGTPLGDLVCAIEDLLSNVAGLVNLLNRLLGLLTGLLGGGGGAPPVM